MLGKLPVSSPQLSCGRVVRSCWVKTSSIISTVGDGRVVRSCWVKFQYHLHSWGWLGGAIVLGKLPVLSPQLGGGRVVRSCWVKTARIISTVWGWSSDAIVLGKLPVLSPQLGVVECCDRAG